MTDELIAVTAKLPESDLRRIPDRNTSRFIRDAVHEKLEREQKPGWKPRSSRVRRMAALRSRYLAAGGETLAPEAIASEMRARRGGLA
jgi:hypothetical protein